MCTYLKRTSLLQQLTLEEEISVGECVQEGAGHDRSPGNEVVHSVTCFSDGVEIDRILLVSDHHTHSRNPAKKIVLKEVND